MSVDEVSAGDAFPQAAPQGRKRKAEDVLPEANDKILKKNPTTGPKSNPTPPPSNTRPPPSVKPTDNVTPSSIQKVPYRGTSRPLDSDKSIPNQAPAKDIKRPSIAINSSTQSIPGRPTNKTPTAVTPTIARPSTPAAESAKVPKKNSYAEIMARGKALVNTPPIGVIKHQPKDKKALSDKKEIMLQKGFGRKPKSAQKEGHSRTSSADMSSESRPGSAGKLAGPAKKKPPEIAYKGTAKPKPQPTYKGTMKPVTTPTSGTHKKPPVKLDDRSRGNSSSRPLPAKRRHTEYSEDEEDDEEEEEEYDSGSDMEAGYSDVEEEETKATKIAKKEDEFEARMEAEMKRQKEARKKRGMWLSICVLPHVQKP